MSIFSKETPLSTIIFHNPDILVVLNRIGIFLGVGDKDVKQAAIETGLDSDFLLAMLNTYSNEDYFPEEILRNCRIQSLTEYIRLTDIYWKEIQLPNILHHFDSLLQRSRKSSNILLLKKFFDEMAAQLSARIKYDISDLIPLLNRIDRGEEIMDIDLAEICEYTIEEKIGDLLSFFIIHLKGEYDRNLCRAVVTAIFTLNNDVKQDNRIRSRILLPFLQQKLNL